MVAVAIAIVVVIVVIPVALRVPTVAIFIPPAMTVVPAKLTRFPQFGPGFLGLPALPSMMFDGLMETMICSRNAPLAIVVGAQSWRTGED
jgi:hypothetical protein